MSASDFHPAALADAPDDEALPESDLPEPPRGGLLRPVLFIATVAGCLLLFYLSPLHAMFVPSGIDRLRDELARFGHWSPVMFVVAAALCIGFGAPRLAFAAAGGLLFGWWLGAVLAHVGTMLGCTITFSWSRRLGRGLARRLTGARMQRLLGRVERHPVATNVLLRICPVGNSLALNLLFGLSTISLRDFLTGTLVGTLPETVIYALFGSSAHAASASMLLTAAFLLLVLAVVSTWLLRRSPAARR